MYQIPLPRDVKYASVVFGVFGHWEKLFSKSKKVFLGELNLCIGCLLWSISQRKGLVAFLVLTVTVLSVSYSAYLFNVNHDSGFRAFKNLEFGTDLEIIVAPHGIYTDKYVHFENYQRLDFEGFVEVCEETNATVYWEGNGGTRFWAYPLESLGVYYQVPFKWS